VLRLWIDRRFRLAALYTVAYAAICLFWILYWGLILPAISAEANGGLASFAARAWDMLVIDIGAIELMIRNLLRFIAWQNPFVLVLFIAAMGGVRRWKSPMPELLAGIALTLLTVTFLMPHQGHGWGYRYLHGLLGSFSLIAAYGWLNIGKKDVASVRGAFAACTAFALLMVPVRAWQVRDFTRPYAEASAAIARTDADLVLIDPTDIWYGGDLVRNDPYLRNRPKVVVLNYLAADDVARLCGKYRIAVFDKADALRAGFRPVPFGPFPKNARLRSQLARDGCVKSKVP
jgi:hypothetical protein